MPLAMEVVGGYRANPGETIQPVIPMTGDSFLVKNANPAKKNFLGSVWAYLHQDGVVRVRSPKMHDNVQGINFYIDANNVTPPLFHDITQTVYPQDLLTVELSGSNRVGDIEQVALLMYYEDLPGVSSRLVNWTDIAARIRNIFTVRIPITTNATDSWTGTTAINSYIDLFKANVDYAILGYLTDPMLTAVGIRGPDTGNMRVGGPGFGPDYEKSRDFFVQINRKWGVPTIPVVNGSNKFSTTIDVMANESITSAKITLIMAELG